jgi:hypothetical protein
VSSPSQLSGLTLTTYEQVDLLNMGTPKSQDTLKLDTRPSPKLKKGSLEEIYEKVMLGYMDKNVPKIEGWSYVNKLNRF